MVSQCKQHETSVDSHSFAEPSQPIISSPAEASTSDFYRLKFSLISGSPIQLIKAQLRSRSIPTMCNAGVDMSISSQTGISRLMAGAFRSAPFVLQHHELALRVPFGMAMAQIAQISTQISQFRSLKDDLQEISGQPEIISKEPVDPMGESLQYEHLLKYLKNDTLYSLNFGVCNEDACTQEPIFYGYTQQQSEPKLEVKADPISASLLMARGSVLTTSSSMLLRSIRLRHTGSTDF
ncbi:unnamed protein product [Protopolystoma xenopodis]|uniref:Uncharacterized protein n=1 Tax=Protopolystoma xenopodis TaxID=117903 RepID=A0A448WB03_9PLAT|nr:unnamed protein product [Protopolystoma xenopodis]